MNILIACEFSGKVRQAFRNLGHNAISCDLVPSADHSPYHVICDVKDLLPCGWDMMIAFPPCTRLARSGGRYFKYYRKEQEEALDFVRLLMAAPIPLIAIENPVGVISSQIKKPTQYIHPWQFGHGEVKKTCLWLKGLPSLVPTNIVEGRSTRLSNLPPSPDRAMIRSITYQGIADAMAQQWGNVSRETYEKVS